VMRLGGMQDGTAKEGGIITAEELLVGCFLKVDSIKVCRLRNGVLVVRYIWPRTENPFEGQVLWLLYHPNKEKMEEVWRDLEAMLEGWDRKVLLIDEHREISLAVEVSMLGDGRVWCHQFTRTYEADGATGCIGAIVGQDRGLDLGDRATKDALVLLLGNALGTVRGAEKDPFLRVCIENIQMLEEKLREAGSQRGERGGGTQESVKKEGHPGCHQGSPREG